EDKGVSKDSEYNFTGLNILMADDSEVNQELISELLTSRGVNLTVVDNGQKAIELASIKEFDVILMDVNMPETDGIEASLAISQINKSKNIPIIAISAQEKNNNEQLSSGFVDYISKPYEKEELYYKIQKWVLSKKGVEHKRANEFIKQENFENTLTNLVSYGINANEGLKRVNGKINVYESLLSTFRKNYSGLKIDFERAMENGQTNEIKRLIHTVKGASGTIGATKLSVLARELETDLKTTMITESVKEVFLPNYISY
ncbi:MAG: response regulator, partial [Chloroflexia bacterium]|nr:response regulator [Chloroflexia bacterium]